MRRLGLQRGRTWIQLPLTLLLTVTGLLLNGCRGTGSEGDSSLIMELAISPTPPGVGPARLIISLSDTAGRPVSGARIQVEGNMSHAGMAPVLDTATMSGPGHYLVPSFTFNMAGDWVLTVDVTLPDGRTASFQKETIVASVPPGLSPDTGQDVGAREDPGPGTDGGTGAPGSASRGGAEP